MLLAAGLAHLLPQRFLGVIPLYIGTEIVLMIAILNKAGGVFGILSIITGHPLNFWQWLYNILAVLVLPFYISALLNLTKRPQNVRKISLACLLYTADTVVGLFYTIYFIYYWFSREDNRPTAESLQPREFDPAAAAAAAAAANAANAAAGTNYDSLSSQSASQGRELFVTISSTIIITVFRFYFTLVIASFTRSLIKQDRVNENDCGGLPGSMLPGRAARDYDSVMVYEKGWTGRCKKFINEMELKSKLILREFFMN